MTVQTNTNSIVYVGNGSTANFDYDFLILDASHLKVYFGDVLQTSGYVVSGVLSQTGGTVAFAPAPGAGVKITLTRSVPFLQLTDYQAYDAFPAESHERALDLLTMMTQQLKGELGRTMQHPVGGNKWDAKGNEIINVGTGSSGTSAANINQVKHLIASEVGDDPSASASVRSREALRRSYAEAGYNLVDGSFQTGFTLVNANDVALDEATGRAFSGPAGVVAAGTDPVTSGGFVDRSDHTLRSEVDEMSRLTSRYATLQAAADAKRSVFVDMDYSLTAAVSVSDMLDITAVDDPVISVQANKIAFNVSDVAKGVMRGLEFVGAATPTDTASSMAVNTQTALPVNYVTYDGIVASCLTLGLNLTKGRGNKVIGGKFGGMVYSPSTLGSAGGYGVLLQGERDVEIACTHFVATATDRHAVYTSKVSTDPVGIGGCENVDIHDVVVDWLATNGTDDESKIPFPARSPRNWKLRDSSIQGGAGGVIVRTGNGSARDIFILNNNMRDMESRNSQFCTPISVGQASTGYGVVGVIISGNRTRISRGSGQPPARDAGGLFAGISQMLITDHISTVDTGVMFGFTNCTDVLIDNVTDIVSGSNGPNIQPVLNFSGSCSKFTIGNVMHNRPDISGKKALFGGLANMTDMTCTFTRTFRVLTNGAGGFTLLDPWDLVAYVTLNANNIVIQFRSHVTQQAADEAQYRMTSATHANAYRSNSVGKTGTVFVMTFAGAVADPQTSTFTIEGVLTE